MPFKSKKQETYLKINEPKVYKKWKRDYKNGGVNLQIPGVNLNMTESDVTATVQDGPTWAQINKPFSQKGDASILIEQELNVTDDGRVSLKAWDREGTGGAGAEVTFQNENLSVTGGRSNKENYVGVEGRIPFNGGGLAEKLKEEASDSAEKDFRASTGKIKDGKWVPHKKIKEKREKMWIPKDADIEDAYQPLNKGGMVGCPMDGAIMKGGTKIKPNRYKNGKREV